MAISFWRASGTRQQEIRKIRADDQHDEPTAPASTRRAVRRRPVTNSSRETIWGRMSCAAGYSLVKLLAERAQFGPRALDGGAGVQTSDDGDGISPAVDFGGEREGKVEIDAAAGGEDRAEIEGGG